MPVIETLDAKKGLEIGSAPNPQFDTSIYRAAAQQGAALAGLGQDISSVAYQFMRREEQTQDFSARLGLQQTVQGIQTADQEALASIPANGEGWHEARTKEARAKLDGFVSTLPPRLQQEFKQRADLAFGGLEEGYAGQQLKQRSAWATDNVKSTAEGAENAVFTNPDALETQRAGLRDLIKAAPVSELDKQKWLRAADEALEVARIKGLAQRDPEAARKALGAQSADGAGYIRYANQGATRSQPLNDRLVGSLSFLKDMGVTAEVFSGGQPGAGEGGNRVGTTRHDHGNAADVFFYKDGRKLDWANEADRRIFQEIVRKGRAAGLTGFGAGPGYMQAGSMHIGFGKEGVWGAGGASATAPMWLRQAYGDPRSAPAATFAPVSAQQFFGSGVDVSRLPAGMRNNNPGNIKYSGRNAFGGVVGPSQNTDQGDPQAVFSSPQAGMVAAAQLALKKFDGGKTTVNDLIAARGGWTPGNSQAALNIANNMGVSANDQINLRDPAQMTKFLRALITQEHGDASKRYSDDLIREAAGSAISGGVGQSASGRSFGTILGEAPEGARSISYERRIALLDDVERMARAQEVRSAAAAQADAKSRINALEIAILDGKAGVSDVQQARSEGWLNDATDVRRVMNQIEERDKGVIADRDAIEALADDTKVWDPTDGDDKKRVDRVFDLGGGAQKLVANDQQFVQGGLLPLIDRTGLIPKGARGALAGMMRSSSPATLDTAFSLMDQIDRRNPVAFERDMGADAVKKLGVWRDRRAYDTPQAVADAVRKIDDPSEIKARQTLETQGLKLAAEKVSDSDILGHFDTAWFSDPRMPADPVVGGQLRVEFNRLYAEQYALTQDEGAAKEQAFRRLGTVWGMSPTSGGRLMKNAPEKFSPTINGTHDWMRQQLAEDLKPLLGKPLTRTVGGRGGAQTVTDGYAFDIDDADPVLVADDRTEAAIGRGERPSYGVQIKDKDGILTSVRDAQNRMLRVSFDPKPFEAKAAEKLNQDRLWRQQMLDGSGAADPSVYPGLQ